MLMRKGVISMQVQILEPPTPARTDAASTRVPAAVLLRLWGEAEQAIAAQRMPDPPTRLVGPAVKLATVRYATD